MADIFISYSKQSKAEAEQLANELQAKGFTVWYDTRLIAGDNFGDVIMSELAQARAAIVMWDSASVKSEWVRSEASRARARRILIPVRAEGIRSHDIPPPFDSLHTELLSNRVAIDAALATLGVIPGRAASEGKPAILARKRSSTAERRLLSILSCELLPAPTTAGALDPEDLRDSIDDCHRCIAEIVGRFNGTIGQMVGNVVLAHFGYPAAHEHDAEQAVRAALELCSGAAGIERGDAVQFRVRVGIATGHVIIEAASNSSAGANVPVGEALGIASQLQHGAQPDSVVIDSATRHLIGGLFECHEIKISDTAPPLHAWSVQQESSVESRFEAMHATGLTTLVGREEEAELLARRWSRAKTSEGQVVLLSGEAGIGKSRLTAAFLERLATELHTPLRYFCSPHHTDSALYPVIAQMERAAGLVHDDKLAGRLDKLDALLAETSTPIQDRSLFAEMLSLPNDGRYPAIELTPPQRRQRTLEALISQIETLTRRGPVLMIFEDAHWIDPTTLESLGRTVDRIRTLRVLLIITFRPEFDSPWIGQPHVTALTINRLAQREVSIMIDHVVGNKLLSASIRQDIVERTDGIPLFVEEMTKAILEAAGEGEARRTAAAVPSPVLAVPATLHASLMARLDRLGTAKEVAQIGAAIGRDFSHALLSAVVREPATELGSALDRLIQAGLLFRHGAPPHATYLFKHALVQDAAYGTLLREPRRALHARIAETLESQFAEIAESRPELLAHHCTEAGLIEKAAGLWGKAGQQSLTRSALVEAAEQLTRALRQIAALPASPALRREQIKIQVALITPLIHVKGYAAPETKAAVEHARLLIERAEALGEPPDDPTLLFSMLYGVWVTNYVAFNGDVVRELAVQFLALAEKQGEILPLMIGHRIMGISLLFTGEVAESPPHYDRALALYDPTEHAQQAMHSGGAALSYRSIALWLLGYPDAGLRDTDDALKDARAIGQAAKLMYALAHAALVNVFCGKYATATALAEELLALSEEKGSLFWKTWGVQNQGLVLALTGKASDAVQLIASGITAFRSTGGTHYIPFRLAHLAMAHAELDQFDDAWRCIGEATTSVETTKEKWAEAEIHRTAGEIALILQEPDAAKAEAYFERALAVARMQRAKSWELRAAMSMARLRRDQGKRDAARNLLAPVYGWFTEGFDTLDLKEAKALLDELAS
jgi:class 3 adenylate cyclase/predicted ATPase